MADGYALALQAALVAAIKADADVSGLVGVRVYDESPQRVNFPYVRIGAIEPRPLRTDGKSAASVAFSIEAHSRPNAGRAEATQVIEAVVAALDEIPLTVTGFDVVQVQWRTQTAGQNGPEKSYTAIAAFETLLDG